MRAMQCIEKQVFHSSRYNLTTYLCYIHISPPNLPYTFFQEDRFLFFLLFIFLLAIIYVLKPDNEMILPREVIRVRDPIHFLWATLHFPP